MRPNLRKRESSDQRVINTLQDTALLAATHLFGPTAVMGAIVGIAMGKFDRKRPRARAVISQLEDALKKTAEFKRLNDGAKMPESFRRDVVVAHHHLLETVRKNTAFHPDWDHHPLARDFFLQNYR